MSSRQRLVHRTYDQFIRENPVGMSHPAFAKIAHFPAIKPSPKLSCALRISITFLPPAPRHRRIRAQQGVIELADRLDRVFQLLVIVQPAAHLGTRSHRTLNWRTRPPA